MGSNSADGRHIRSSGRTRIVGLGASAGGLKPLGEFLAHVPAASGLAYVVVQHMDPTHKTMLSELLQRSTAMPVHEVIDSQVVEADTVYVIPPNGELAVADGVLHLKRPSQPRGMGLPIDILFASLASELGERAVAVVLSGMGSDGTLGLRAIRRGGGLALVQSPESAEYESMPSNAIASGCVDVVALPAEMPARILGAEAAMASAKRASPGPPAAAPNALGAILGLLHARSKHDLTQYKSSTLQRRIERRMATHALGTMEAYAAFLGENGQELDLLFKELLIGVTAFFRDAAAWTELKETVLPDLLARRRRGDAQPLRAWVVGCSTGEEAYSLAMAFREVAESQPEFVACELQVFATDLSADAIAIARAGCYPAARVRDLESDRLNRFFVATPNGYQVAQPIRDMVLFAQHDVILDPPFTRLDLLSCRNLMIYFDAALQERLMPLFHYSLLPGGALLLGASETVGRSQAMFRPLHPKSRLYWRSDNGNAVDARYFPTRRRPGSCVSVQETNLAQPDILPANLQTLADQLLLQEHAPPAILVNADGDIVYISGRTGRYLEPAAGKANWNIHAMARPGIRAQVTVALRTVMLERTTIELRGLGLDGEAAARVDITVQAILRPGALEGMAMIVFRSVPAPRPRRRGKPGPAADAAVMEELIRAREEISALRQEMQASKEELQAANEELQSANEELQSANEELTTSKEEAQSMNEELQTINGELQTKLDDLALAQSDMQNPAEQH